MFARMHSQTIAAIDPKPSRVDGGVSISGYRPIGDPKIGPPGPPGVSNWVFPGS